MSEWQPIETAPKDGTHVIVGFDFASVWIVHIAWYEDDSSPWAEPDSAGWWSYIQHSVTQEKLVGHYEPTHWIPLPRLPITAPSESASPGEPKR